MRNDQYRKRIVRISAFLVAVLTELSLLCLPTPATAKPAAKKKTRGEELRITGEVVTLTKRYPLMKSPTDTKPAKPAKMEVKKERHRVIVYLGKDRFSVRDADGTESMYDFPNTQVVRIDRKAKTYTTRSLYADVYFRVMEIQNRSMINQMLGKVLKEEKKKDAFLRSAPSRFDLESIFGVGMPQEEDGEEIEKTLIKYIYNKDKTWLRFQYEGKTVVEYKQSKQGVPKALKKTMTRWFAHCFPIHPAIRKRIISLGYIPKRMVIHNRQLGEESTTTWTLSFAKTIAPPPPDAWKKGLSPAKPEDQLDKILASIDLSKRPEEKEVIAEIDKALEAEHYLDAALTALEYGLSTGEPMTEQMREIMNQAQGDEACRKLFQNLHPKNKEEAKQFVEALESIDRSKLQKGYVLDIFLADAKGDFGHPGEAVELFLGVLGKNPFIAGAYKDLGEMYSRQYQMDKAWKCYKAAQKLAPQHSLVKQIPILEKKMRKKLSDFF